ncbi:MAG: plastocyanin/azurin family copper-binding protein [Solirubrobacterales bacterium]
MRPNNKLFSAAAVLVSSVVIAGCGNDSKPDLVNGKDLFAAKCGSCHTLARVPTAKGVVGPNLDDAFVQSRRDGMLDSTIAGVTEKQIAFPSLKLTPASLNMPADIVTGIDARDVAAYVGYAAGRGGQDQGALAEAGKPKVNDKVIEADSTGALQIDAAPTGTLFEAGKAVASSGAVKLVMDNPASVEHNIAIRGNGVDVKGAVVNKGGQSRADATLKAGEYTFYCSVPGHEAGGMKGTLTVE